MVPLNFWLFAEWLIENKKCPEGFRSSVSRAYYGALHTAIQFLEEMGIYIPSTDNKHDRVPDLLQHSGDAELIKTGERLKNLREERNRADYRLGERDVEAETFAKLRLQDAKNIISGINNCLTTKGKPNGRFEQVRQLARKRADFLMRGIS